MNVYACTQTTQLVIFMCAHTVDIPPLFVCMVNSTVKHICLVALLNVDLLKLFIEEVLFLLTGDAGEVCGQPLTL